MASVSLSAPVTVQLGEYIDPTIGVATLDTTLTVMVGSGDEMCKKTYYNYVITSLTLHSDGPRCWVHSTAQCSSTCVCPSMRGCQWVKCQRAYATICHYSRCNHGVCQPGDGWLIIWPSHGNSSLQTVALSSSGSTRRNDGGNSDSYKCRWRNLTGDNYRRLCSRWRCRW